MHGCLQHEPMITEHVAMVARKNHDGVVAGAFDCSQDFPDRFVDEFNRRNLCCERPLVLLNRRSKGRQVKSLMTAFFC